MERKSEKKYVGLDNDIDGGMTPTGKIIRDAWVFGIIPETETCEGWTRQGIESLYDKVSKAWEPFGHLVSQLPPDLQQRHRAIYEVAVKKARASGWDPELGDDD